VNDQLRNLGGDVYRIRPTPYADLHVGHVWIAWQCWQHARRSGGKFIVMFDDIQYEIGQLWCQSFKLGDAIKRYMEDLCWLGMEPDLLDHIEPRTFPNSDWEDEWPRRYAIGSINAEQHAWAAEKLRLAHRRPAMVGTEQYLLNFVRPALGGLHLGPSYNPWLIMAKAVDDHEAQVSHFFRGHDLAPEEPLKAEQFLYDHFYRQLYGGLTPHQSYVLNIRREVSGEKESKGNVSGTISLRDMRKARYCAAEIIETLRECARVSIEKKQAHIVIPKGVLEIEARKSLRRPIDAVTGGKLVHVVGFPWRKSCQDSLRNARKSVENEWKEKTSRA